MYLKKYDRQRYVARAGRATFALCRRPGDGRFELAARDRQGQWETVSVHDTKRSALDQIPTIKLPERFYPAPAN